MKTGLLLVDIQNDYFKGGLMELVGMDEAASRAKDLLLLFRENQWPTFHIQHIATGKDATFFLPDTFGVDIHESVKPLLNDVVITKKHPNSFRETMLIEELTKASVKRVVICGAMSHMCIDATTRAAADLGFDCFVIHDGCATKNLEFGGETIPAKKVHGSFMAALGSAYARVLSFNEFLAISKIGQTT
ncbi:MAG: isochorismatase family protein [Spirochaeta sp.]|nr:isochorismatase family protein [Spirochaeta sp.]